MNEPTLQMIREELADGLIGQKFGKVFVISKLRLAIDFRLSDALYLFISVEPNSPRIYLVKRKLKDLSKESNLQLSFVSFLRKRLAHAVLKSIEKVENERILKFELLARNEFGQNERYSLVVQLTGKSANLFLLDENERILDSLRPSFGSGQEMAEKYSPPLRENPAADQKEWKPFPTGSNETLSEALDTFYREKETRQIFQSKVQTAKSSLNKDLKKLDRLVKKLNQDLKGHGDGEKWKRFGDLLLANASTAKRQDDKLIVTDYFDEQTPEIGIEAAPNLTISEAAEKYFKRYTKARNAREEISKRLAIAEAEIRKLIEKQEQLDEAILTENLEAIEKLTVSKKRQKTRTKKSKRDSSSYYHEFKSSDGYEILVGKRSKDNDYLTFRIARSLDTWMHAADYPGSHVIIRNPNRSEIPHRTLVEAAQLAAFYSKAKNEAKAGVHYTQKKFVNKPKGAPPGLVSLSSFKTILVKPKVKPAD